GAVGTAPRRRTLPGSTPPQRAGWGGTKETGAPQEPQERVVSNVRRAAVVSSVVGAVCNGTELGLADWWAAGRLPGHVVVTQSGERPGRRLPRRHGDRRRAGHRPAAVRRRGQPDGLHRRLSPGPERRRLQPGMAGDGVRGLQAARMADRVARGWNLWREQRERPI